jgi:hypothetical protein
MNRIRMRRRTGDRAQDLAKCGAVSNRWNGQRRALNRENVVLILPPMVHESGAALCSR